VPKKDDIEPVIASRRQDVTGRRDVTRASSGSGRRILEAEIAQKTRILLTILRPKMPGARGIGNTAIIGHRAFSDPLSAKKSAQRRRDAQANSARYGTKNRFFCGAWSRFTARVAIGMDESGNSRRTGAKQKYP